MEIKQYLQDIVYLTAVRKMQRRDNLRDCSNMEREIREALLRLAIDQINETPLHKCSKRDICIALIETYTEALERYTRGEYAEIYTKARNACPDIMDKIEELKDINPFKIKEVLPKAEEILEQLQEQYKTNDKS